VLPDALTPTNANPTDATVSTRDDASVSITVESALTADASPKSNKGREEQSENIPQLSIIDNITDSCESEATVVPTHQEAPVNDADSLEGLHGVRLLDKLSTPEQNVLWCEVRFRARFYDIADMLGLLAA
jgi:hypothetical protein